MNSRSRLLLTLVLGLTAGACASGGATTTPDEPTSTPSAQGRTFPPGTEPTRNTWTRSAQVYLDQAENSNATDEKERRYTEALAQARLSIQNQEGNPLGYYQAGIALNGLGQYAEAAQMFDRAEELYPRYILETGPIRERAWVNLYNAAVQALQASDEERAVQQMLLADQIYQGRPEARTNLAVIYTNRGDYAQAIEWYQKTLETLRSEERQYKPANVQAEWAEQETDIVFNMAQVYQRMDRQADAIRLYREYLATNPNDASVKTQLALALSQEGQEAEAAQLFSEVLNMEGLADDDLYQIGIGLFNAGRFADAATAFDRAVAANAYFRDAGFNLTQALMALANEREGANAPAAEQIAIYERLVRASEALRGIDPSSRTAALVLAQTYRNLADLTSGATSTEWRNRLLAQLELIQDLPVDVSNVTLAAAGPGRVRLSGQVENLNVNPGSPINLRLTILGPGGAVLGTQDVTVTAPAREATVSFSQEFQVSGEIAGWRYEQL
jgi:tetratricopeptide (TPR) repeat protein